MTTRLEAFVLEMAKGNDRLGKGLRQRLAANGFLPTGERVDLPEPILETWHLAKSGLIVRPHVARARTDRPMRVRIEFLEMIDTEPEGTS